jgi:AsmA-like C-terminal region
MARTLRRARWHGSCCPAEVVEISSQPAGADAQETQPPKRPLRKNPWFWAGVGTIVFVVVFAAMFVAAVPLSTQVLRSRIIDYLSRNLDSEVELGDLQLRVFPAMRVEGANLVIRKFGRRDVPPLISIKSFHVDASVTGLFRKHVQHVRVDGLDINIPPDKNQDRNGDGKKDQADQADNAEPRTDSDRRGGVERDVVIDTLDSVDARLIIIPDEPDKNPKIWAIHRLRMHDVGVNESMPFEATLTNGVPPGEIAVQGSFGPWHTNDEGDTPLKGSFDFARADLSVFKGIAGTLASKGSFVGTLAKLKVNGETDTPDFKIMVGGHPFPLHVKYQALVDGTNGDTRLEDIDANFLGSHLKAQGAVLDAPKGTQGGRTVSLDVVMDKARIEDIMTMAVNTPKPPMTGALRMKTKFLLPPGDRDVVDRLRLNGDFAIGRARFTNYDVQGKIEELSKRARAKIAAPEKEHVVSNFQGRFKLADGRLALPHLTFDVPGAKVELAGAYGLKRETIDFQGRLLLDAKISQTVTGIKSVLLKVVDPLFKQKDGTGSAIPIKIGGTRSAPAFGLDTRRVFKRGN